MVKIIAWCIALTIGLSTSLGFAAKAKPKPKGGTVKHGRPKSGNHDKSRQKAIYDSPVVVEPSPIEVPSQSMTPAVTLTRPSKTRHQINSMFGIHVVKGSALLTGIQYGYRGDRETPLFLGIEYNFSLYSPGSIFGVMAGGWYEIPIEGKNGPSTCLGIVAGAGFTTAVIATPPTVFLGFFDFAYSQPVDDLFDLRIQLRPGYMYRYLAFMMNLSVAFRLA